MVDSERPILVREGISVLKMRGGYSVATTYRFIK